MTQTEDQGTIWLTQQAHDQLQAELDDLKGPRWNEIVERISAARDEGDLKENGGYHAAKDEQGRMKGRIDQLEQMLRRVTTERPEDDGVVNQGKVVTYKFEGDDDDEAETFLLGARENELDPSVTGDVFSAQAPLGGALLGHAKGETVPFEAPTGKTLKVVIVDATPYGD
ncbi:transcription elongation factor GreA [Nocardioides panacisoli]|uniref:transcription elongation factor GreA n=1 Tax=Nocardioides panacisoli TaxID=627624 RepID=UPI001C62AE32|nr:transcription elongation factor GreA [Nocardioides panacisoli]QYJ04148.1 transcription elongation factor GreA [Nocardioides panacisoli]